MPSALSSASDQSVTVLCTQRSGSASFVAVSTDGGRTFQPGKLLPNLEIQVGSASSSTVFAIGSVGGRESLVRSVDRGLTWTVVAQSGPVTGTAAPRSGFLGFESATTGRWVSLTRSPHRVDNSRRRRDLGQLHDSANRGYTGLARLG